MSYKIGFVMDQIAGHVTNYHNMRNVALLDPELQATWHEIHYYKSGGAIEQMRERVLPFCPPMPLALCAARGKLIRRCAATLMMRCLATHRSVFFSTAHFAASPR